MRVAIALLLLAASISFALGISLPIVRFEKLYFLSETPSIIGLIGGLWADDGWRLAVIVFLFSVLFPILKLAVTHIAAMAPARNGLPNMVFRHASALSKWSMMDVMLVAIVVFAAKTSGLTTAATQPGLWFYALSVACGAVAAMLLKRSLSDAGGLPQDGNPRSGS
ncbi:MAG: paraquat-inducible protein A [Ahrensia sp.]|nr:paraquat-inducible protein A [Ahrensia sp.]